MASPEENPQPQPLFVQYTGFRADPAWRRLPYAAREDGREAFAHAIEEAAPEISTYPYSTVGLKADCDFLIWRISQSPDAFQEQSQMINKTRLGAYLTMPYSFVSMTKRSMYIDKLDTFHTAESRTHIITGKRKYLFVYPFVKTRDWYLLPLEKRQEIMDVHIKIGHEFPSVKLNTTYSFGLDDQDFVVAFETESPSGI